MYKTIEADIHYLPVGRLPGVASHLERGVVTLSSQSDLIGVYPPRYKQ